MEWPKAEMLRWAESSLRKEKKEQQALEVKQLTGADEDTKHSKLHSN